MSDDSKQSEGDLIQPEDPGRPTIYGPAIVGKLVAAFHNGYSITEACIFAGINRDTYYDWLEKKEGFSDKMSDARSMINRKAKEVVTKAIAEGDTNLAFRYLERRDPDFKPKMEQDTNLGLQKTREKIKDFLDDTDDGAYDDDAGAKPDGSTEPEGGDEVATPTPDIS